MSPRSARALLALAAFLTSGCDVQVSDKGVSVDLVEGRASDEWTRTYDLASGGRLEILNANGPIEAFPATGPQVEVRVSRQVTDRTDEAARQVLDGIRMIEEVSPGRVKVEAPDTGEFRGFGRNVRISYRVAVPPGRDVLLKTQNGPVRVENVEGQLTASSTNGSITGERLAGSVDASTVNGGITVSMRAIEGDSRFVTVNGRIRLSIPSATKATVAASAVNGGVTVDEDLPLEASERSRLRVSGSLNGGGPTVEARTTNGRVRIGAGEAP